MKFEKNRKTFKKEDFIADGVDFRHSCKNCYIQLEYLSNTFILYKKLKRWQQAIEFMWSLGLCET